MAGLSALVLVVVLLGWFSAGSSFFVPVAVVGVPVALVAILGVRRFNVDYLRASTGVRAEARVARVLGRSACVAVVHGALLDRGDVDHVVLGPALAVIETKHGRGQISFDGGGSLRVGGRRLPRDPLTQARANASRLSERLGRQVDAVVVVVDATSPASRRDGVWVCSLGELPAVLGALPARLDASTALALGRALPVAG